MRRVFLPPLPAAAFVLSASLMLAAAPSAFAADTIVLNGQTVGPQAVTGIDTLTVDNGGTVSGGGSDAVVWSGPSAAPGVVIDNAGTIISAGDRGIDTSGGSATRNITVINHAGALIQGDGDAFRINADIGASTVDVTNSGTIFSATGQALDFNAIASTTGTVTITNLAGGLIRAAEADAVRPGQGAIVDNAGTICVGDFTAGVCSGGVPDESHDGVDWQGHSGTLINRSGGVVSGAHHGTTSDVDVDVTNETGATIIGRNGSGVGSDGDGTVVNFGTITGTVDGVSVDGDGDGVDIDFLAGIANHGTIQGIGAAGVGSDGQPNSADGIAMGGGTVTNFAGASILGGANGILADDSSNGGAFFATTLTNAGAIDGGTGYGVRLVGAQNDTVTNSGGIAGGTAAIDLGAGDDLLTLDTGSVLTGLADGGAGFDTLAIAGAVTLGLAINFEELQLGLAGLLTLDSSLAFDAVTGLDIFGGTVANVAGNGFNLLYDFRVAANAYLGGLDYALTGGGALRAVPEAGALALTGLGLLCLGAAALRRRRA
jgi:hypothetical protein